MSQTIQERIDSGEFRNVLPFPADATLDLHPAYQALDKELSELLDKVHEIKKAKKALRDDMRIEYDNESVIRRDAFRHALEEEYGLQDHPKREQVWMKAWDDGHSGGWGSIHNVYAELAELVS